MFESVQVMTAVYLLYGMSFLLLALGIALSIRKAAHLKIVGAFAFLALFGLIHGLKEICDLGLFLWPDLPEGDLLKAFSAALMLISFVLLIEFALNILDIRRSRQWTTGLPWMFAAALLGGLVAAGGVDLASLDHYGRWVLGAPAALLSMSALFVLGARFRPLGSRSMVAGARGAAFAFALYAFFVAWVKPAVGPVPVQICRAACALFLTGSALIMLHGFWVASPPPPGTD